MFALFGGLGNKLKSQKGKIRVDNMVFRLHYRVTVTIMILCSILVSSYQFIGAPIMCIPGGSVPKGPLNAYCWITTTFTIPGHNGGEPGKDVAFPGVGPKISGQEQKFHAYYQWVPFVLVFEALLFYLPRFMWKNFEGGRLANLIMDLNSPRNSADEFKAREKTLVTYFISHLHSNNFWFYRYVFCELLNLIIVISNIFFLDRFLGYEFLNYGSKVLDMIELDPEDRYDPMYEVFPRLTKCDFHKYGPSGTIQNIDALCVLALNIINEKIFVFLWFWLVTLAVVTSGGFIYRIITMSMGGVRKNILKMMKAKMPQGCAGRLDIIMQHCQLGDWFLLTKLVQHMNPIVSRVFIQDLASDLEVKKETLLT